MGAYAYGATSNRLVSVTPSGGTAMTYAYDSNGNLTGGDGRTLSYTSFDKPHTITKGTGQTVKFAYDGERARYKRSVTTGTGTNAVTTTTYYVGNVEIRNVTGGKQYTRYVEGHAIVKLTRNDSSRSAISTDYLITDHLGSIDAIADSSGALLYDLSFDAWGRRRAADSTFAIINTPATALTTLTPRGFTGHEMLDTVGLIHMNGRVYDPRLGRFTSADPIVQFPYYSQSFNHYSYVLNNPLGYTDPSGYGVDPFTVFRIFVAVVLTYACNGVCAPEVWAWTFGSIGGIEAAANGGDFFAVATAAFTSAALAYVGAEYGLSGGEFTSIEALQFGALGGITSVLQGGKFGHGFVAAGLGAAAGSIPGLEGAGFQAGFTRVLVSSVVGGTISEITGGKFANGAAYGAFASIVREGVQPATSDASVQNRLGPERFNAEQQAEIQKEMSLAVSDLPVDGFSSEVAGARYLQSRLQPIAEKYGIEIGSYVFSDYGGAPFFTTQPVTSFHSWTILRSVHPPLRGHALFHTHITTAGFSGFYGDTSMAEQSRANSFLSNTKGLFRYRANDFIYSYQTGGSKSRGDFIDFLGK